MKQLTLLSLIILNCIAACNTSSTSSAEESLVFYDIDRKEYFKSPLITAIYSAPDRPAACELFFRLADTDKNLAVKLVRGRIAICDSIYGNKKKVYVPDVNYVLRDEEKKHSIVN